ncbi:BNR-4 repeat-containing protein [Neolewinella antarctica]|uniref:BNR repeat-containing family member n=1 Tax=Neolewinella antarctica TaxID=442734 RepID=A0ABX0XGJ6_9BACT|nr:BNR-4 repeat-containing protein [Neolewinella antarctica]NJC28463.1 hypothetical protein [Neolewinella antarctica]
MTKLNQLIGVFLLGACFSACSPSVSQVQSGPEEKLADSTGTQNELVALDQLVTSHSDVFQLSDQDRPGSWCWFQDQRAVVDVNGVDGPTLLTGVVTYAPEGDDKRGDIDLYWASLNSEIKGDPIKERGRFELDDQLQMDDHASPSFLILPGGGYLVNWSKHGNDKYLRTRLSTSPGDPTSWEETIRTEPTGTGITYTNPYYLTSLKDGRPGIFNGVRSRGFDSNWIFSEDLGRTWTYGGQTVDAKDAWPDDREGGRAYVKYAGDGKSKIHLFSTDDHPRVNFNPSHTAPGTGLNSLYHAYLENGQLFRSDGTVIDEDIYDDNAVPPTDMTVLLQDGTVVMGDSMRRGWITDIKVDPAGNPFGIIQFRANDDADDHRYFYARHDGREWHVNFLAYAGDYIGDPNENDYTGLASVDAANPNTVFVSTSSHPVTGEHLISTADGKRHQEIYVGRTTDLGKTWRWAAVTENSVDDNIRPVVPAWREGTSLVLWMRGDFPTYRRYSTDVIGQVFAY